MNAPLLVITPSAAPLVLAQAADAPPVDPTQNTAAPAGQTPAGQTAQPGQTGQPSTTPPGSGGLFGNPTFMIVILIFVLLWVFLLGGNRKEKKRRKALLETLSKGQRVQTVGGIKGSVVEVRDDEVVVKVDENANTRLRFSKAAIQTVFEDGVKAD